MNTHTHTPGPWLANDDGLVWSDHNSLGKQNVIGAFTQADAALIASAPTMLDALDRIANGEFAANVNKTEQVAAMRAIARSAIAKAKGGAK